MSDSLKSSLQAHGQLLFQTTQEIFAQKTFAQEAARHPERERRYLALWLPFLSTDRARRRLPGRHGGKPADTPFILAAQERGALRITAADTVAARMGLAPGMPLAEARAILPALAVAEADPVADAALLQDLAEACEMFTPLVTIRGGDLLILDCTGCAHLFGGEAAMLRRACGRIRQAGLTVEAAMAGTPEAAGALARHRPGTIAAPDDMVALMHGLPITALGRDAETTLALRRAGLTTLGDLATREPAQLAARFGADLPAALRRVLGEEDIRITPLRAVPEIMAETHFPEPRGEIEGLLSALGRLSGDVAAALARRGEGGRIFEAALFRCDGALRRVVIETAAPLRDPETVMRLIRLRIAALADPLDPGFGFDAIRLAVRRSEAMAERQALLEDQAARQAMPEDRSAQADDLASRLVARLGRDNVRRFVAQDTHDPARAGGTQPFLSDERPSLSGEMACMLPEPGEPPARPLTLFAPPQPIEAMAEVPDSPPLRFRWRRLLHEVMRAEGPERIAPDWWRQAASGGNQPPPIRDYYRVETADGRRFWLYREGVYAEAAQHPRWFLHGLFA